MDPTTCYQMILDALHDRDFARAREYALILRQWLEAGGFHPVGVLFNDVLSTLGKVLQPACRPSSYRFPFTRLICS